MKVGVKKLVNSENYLVPLPFIPSRRGRGNGVSGWTLVSVHSEPRLWLVILRSRATKNLVDPDLEEILRFTLDDMY